MDFNNTELKLQRLLYSETLDIQCHASGHQVTLAEITGTDVENQIPDSYLQ